MVFAVARTMNAGGYSTPCSVVNVVIPSALKRELVLEGFTSYVLRSDKLEGFLFNIDQLPVLTSGGTERWAFV